MRRTIAAAVAITITALVVTACQSQAVMWEPCAKAADGNPWGTDGGYVLACNEGIWQPVMTVGEYLRISRGEKITIAPVPTRPGGVVVEPTVPTTTPTTTPPTTTPTVPPGGRAVDQSNDGAGVGDALMTCDNEYTRAQTFTAGRTGTLDGVSLRTSGTVAASVVIRRVALDGTPTGAQVGAGTYRGGSGAQWTEVPLSSPAAVQAGTVYAAVVTSASGCSGEWSIAVTGDAYAGGTSWFRVPESASFSPSGEDLGFRTWVR
ncbi:hypothetical protein [Dermatobacter hominis]|uniref:hypothetical protein n=1 Tax=Dermatobacter hominis TaxID=2884263 RepID=UPI001D125B3F|nr:hypothetical protein [Dermatobacter hominis]UDY34663.1 hypothetical protein LH044_15140 [Dermatobacter hominis]